MWTVAALEKHQSIKSVLCLHEAVATGAHAHGSHARIHAPHA